MVAYVRPSTAASWAHSACDVGLHLRTHPLRVKQRQKWQAWCVCVRMAAGHASRHEKNIQLSGWIDEVL